MFEIRWNLSGTDKRCERYGPGHWVHWIHHKKSVQESGVEIAVYVRQEGDGLLLLEGPDLLLQRWNHRPGLVSAALKRSAGSAIWLPRWHLLVVPTGEQIDGASNVFNLGAPEVQAECVNPHARPQPAPSPRPGTFRPGLGLPLTDRYRIGSRRLQRPNDNDERRKT